MNTAHPGTGVLALSTSPGKTLAQRIGDAGIELDMRCSGRGVCRGCEVDIGKDRLRSCQITLEADSRLEVTVPSTSILSREALSAEDFSIPLHVGASPVMRADEHGPIDRPFALAVDLGTTTISALLLDRITGEVIARGSTLNMQARYGDNVLTRIQHAMNGDEAIASLKHAVLELSLKRIITKMIRDHPLDPAHIGTAVIAGNTTMLHLVAGVDPKPLGFAPFTPEFLGHHVEPNPDRWAGVAGCSPEVHLLPGAAAYVGADIIAGALAIALDTHDTPALFLDLGTNGEMLLWDGKRMTATATAAGPAFEGVGLSCGVRAGRRAVATINVCPDPASITGRTVAGDVTNPSGLCGSAYIDLLARGHDAGLLDDRGRLTQAARSRFASSVMQTEDNGADIVLHDAHARWQSTEHTRVSERDIASVLQAKAAIQAGTQVLMRRAHLTTSELLNVYVAGGFGTHMNREHAIAIGLLPPVPTDRVTPLGNTSLAGAALVALDQDKLAQAESIARSVAVHTLGHDDDFEDRFISCMSL